MFKKLLLMSFMLSSFITYSQETGKCESEVEVGKLITTITVVTDEPGHATSSLALDDLKIKVEKIIKEYEGKIIEIDDPVAKEVLKEITKEAYVTKKNSSELKRKGEKIKINPQVFFISGGACYPNQWKLPFKISSSGGTPITKTQTNKLKKWVGFVTVSIYEHIPLKPKTEIVTENHNKEETPQIMYRENVEIKKNKTPWQSAFENKPSWKPCEEYGYINHKGEKCAEDPVSKGIFVVTNNKNVKPLPYITPGNSNGSKTYTKEVSEDGGKTWKIIEQKVEQWENKENK